MRRCSRIFKAPTKPRPTPPDGIGVRSSARWECRAFRGPDPRRLVQVDPNWWWVLAVALIVVGVAGTFLPVLPGALLVFGGMLLGAWIDHFQRIGWGTVVVLGVLTVLVFVVDVVAGL